MGLKKFSLFEFYCTGFYIWLHKWDLQNILCWHILHYSCRCSKIHVFCTTLLLIKQIKIFYHITPSVACLPTLRAFLSPPTVCFLIVKQFLVWVGGRVISPPPCTAYGRMHTGADAFFCTAGHPYCSSISSSNSFSKQPTVQYARYCILVPLLLNQPWRTVRGSWCERKEHTCEVKPTWVWELM